MRPDADSASSTFSAPLYGYAYATAWRFTPALGR
jgi:hypothetical protein